MTVRRRFRMSLEHAMGWTTPGSAQASGDDLLPRLLILNARGHYAQVIVHRLAHAWVSTVLGVDWDIDVRPQ